MNYLYKIYCQWRSTILCNTIFMHKDCIKFRKMTQDIVDQEIDEVNHKFFHKHHEWCHPCRFFFYTEQKITQLISKSIKKKQMPLPKPLMTNIKNIIK